MFYTRVAVLLGLCIAVCRGFEVHSEYLFTGEDYFKKEAFKNEKVTDKVNGHSYQKMYGMILLPQIEKFALNKKKLKFLEIGLGCGMYYGPGASVKVWKKMFEGRDVDMWEAEYDEACVKKAKEEGKLQGMNVLTGDQADPAVLKRWVQESGGKFDVIIDDGGHRNNQLLNSFEALWPELNADGNYFLEDLEVAYLRKFQEPGYFPVTKVVQAWIEFLHVDGFSPLSPHHQHIIDRYPLPKGADFISCQKHACVIHKAAVYK